MTDGSIAENVLTNHSVAQQQFALMQTQQAVISDSFELIVSFVFAYMVAAYFIGAKLTKIQTILFSAIYVVWIFFTMVDLLVSITTMRGLTESYSSYGVDVSAVSTIAFYTGGSVDLIFMMLPTLALAGSLYFMWTVRNRSN